MRTIGIVLTLLIASTAWADEPRDDWRGIAIYREGWTAFQLGDFAAARDLAAKSLATRGAPRDEARALYGDALYKLRQYERARNVYIVIERSASPGMRAVIKKKIAACDRMLQKSV